MEKHALSSGTNTRYFHEVMFSLNLSCFILAIIFLWQPSSLVSDLFKLEAFVQRLLGIHPTDLQMGYWAYCLPAGAMTFCIWLLTDVGARTMLGRKVLRSVGGCAALSLPAIYWLCEGYVDGRRYGRNPLHGVGVYELAFILVLLSIFLQRTERISWSLTVVVVIVHYAFWFWEFGPYSVLLGQGGPLFAQPIIGFISAIAWILYMKDRSLDIQRNDSLALKGSSKPK